MSEKELIEYTESLEELERVLVLPPGDELDDIVAMRAMGWMNNRGVWMEGNAGQVGTAWCQAKLQRGFRPTRDAEAFLEVIDSVGCSMSWEIRCNSEGVYVTISGGLALLEWDGTVSIELPPEEPADLKLACCRAALKACWMWSAGYHNSRVRHLRGTP